MLLLPSRTYSKSGLTSRRKPPPHWVAPRQQNAVVVVVKERGEMRISLLSLMSLYSLHHKFLAIVFLHPCNVGVVWNYIQYYGTAQRFDCWDIILLAYTSNLLSRVSLLHLLVYVRQWNTIEPAKNLLG